MHITLPYLVWTYCKINYDISPEIKTIPHQRQTDATKSIETEFSVTQITKQTRTTTIKTQKKTDITFAN